MDDDCSTKSYGGQEVKNSTKLDEGGQSLDNDMKTISQDKLLLIGELVDSGQTEFDERHLSKVEGERDILQSSVSSDPNATMSFGEEKVITRFASLVKAAEAALAAAKAKMEKATKQAASKAKATSKDRAEASGEQKQMVEIDKDGFKIPQGAAHQNQKKLEAAERCKVVDRVLKRELGSTENLVNLLHITHEITHYGLSENEWRYYLRFLVNKDPKKLNLPLVARQLVKELETKWN